MKFLPLLLSTSGLALANTAPTVVVKSAQMRPGTTLLDVVYRVNDPDDATVKTRALAFIDGVRSFAKVIRPMSFVEGTGAKLGDSIPANTDHRLSWDVAADWNIDLGQVKFEVLAMDGRGLLPFDWITIPAAGSESEMTISKNLSSNSDVIDALFWQYADGDAGLSLSGGELKGSAESGNFEGLVLARGVDKVTYGELYVLRKTNFDVLSRPEVDRVVEGARVDIIDNGDLTGWRTSNRPYVDSKLSFPVSWGQANNIVVEVPGDLSKVVSIAAGNLHAVALKSDGTVVAWGDNEIGQTDVPEGLCDVAKIAAGYQHSLALKNDGTVIGWGDNQSGELIVPENLGDVVDICAGSSYSMALRGDGSVVFWGNYHNVSGFMDYFGVRSIAAGSGFALMLKNDGTVIAAGPDTWGGVLGLPAEVTSSGSRVTAIAAGVGHGVALKNDGTVVSWGGYPNDASDKILPMVAPVGLVNVTAIAAGMFHCIALKSDGSVVAWGRNAQGQCDVPDGLTKVTAIAAGGNSFALQAKAP
jgi:hypothetical protein